MTRTELKEIICEVIVRMKDEADSAPTPACITGDNCDTCDATTKYAINEES